MVPLTFPWGNYNFPRGTNKIQFFDDISTSGKICQFNEGWWLGGWWWLVGLCAGEGWGGWVMGWGGVGGGVRVVCW